MGLDMQFIKHGPPPQDSLVIVPPNFKIDPPLFDSGELVIMYNYSMTKAIAAIVQIIYGSYLLQQTSGDEIKKHGYGTYLLMKIP